MSQETKVTSIEQAVSVLIQAVKIGQSKGAYSLEDAAMITQAIQVISGPAEKQQKSTVEQTASENESLDTVG